MALALSMLTAFGLGLALFAWICQAWALARPSLPAPEPAPPVSVLKPLKGLDPGLDDNLRSLFRQDYPDFELIFSVEDAADPAAEVALRLIAAHPGIRARLVVSARRVGLNPKVNNLANAEALARSELLLVSDSNVRVGPDYLADMVARAERPGVLLVSSLIRAQGGSGLGAALETLQLDVFVMGGVAAWSGPLGKPCVVGKSMMLRRSTLDAIGGWEHLGRHLAEDQVCGEDVAALGGRLEVSGRPVVNFLGPMRVRDYVARQLRWARIRRCLTPAGFAGEALLNPLVLSLAAWATGAGAAVPTLTLFGTTLLALSAERRLGVRRNPIACAGLETLRSLLSAAIWCAAFTGGRVDWRGHQLSIGPRTRLIPRDASTWSADETALPATFVPSRSPTA